MIVLDTNVVSEAMRPEPDPAVQAWLNEQASETLHLPSVVMAELLFGLAAMPGGKRRDRLTKAFDGIVKLFSDRILPFDDTGARMYADLMAKARLKGLAISVADGYIAATAAANSMMVATRDNSPFEAAGVPVINPWKAPGTKKA